jgi:hypothetical protein
MQGRCDKHLFEQAEDRCGRCGHEYCAECLVYSFGHTRPPFCIPCAVASSGIRSRAGATLPRRELRRIEKERKAAFKAARKVDSVRAAAAAQPQPDPAPAPDPGIPGYVPSAAR